MLLSENERLQLAQQVVAILISWDLCNEDQMALLGLPPETKPRQMSHYRQGSRPLPEDEGVLERVQHILGIQESLDRLFPLNRNMPRFWIRNRSKLFRYRAPLELMLTEGLAGMGRVWSQIDCTRHWESPPALQPPAATP